VLGSGGARGLAHIGVIRALEENGHFAIRSITGTSIGALIGGLHAGGKLDIYADWVGKLTRSDVWGLLDFSFTNKGLFKGERVMKKLGDLVGEAEIEDLEIPFTAVASDIERRQEVWISEGRLFDAIRASIAIPGLFTPVERDGRILVDGGLLSPLPLAPAQYHRVERSIVVSLNGNPTKSANKTESKAGGRDHHAMQQDSNVLRGWIELAKEMLDQEPDDSQSFNALDTIGMSIEAMQDRIGRYQIATYRPDMVIEIPADACSVLDFHRAKEMIELGYRQAEEALEQYALGDKNRNL
jgi:NTE family protein